MSSGEEARIGAVGKRGIPRGAEAGTSTVTAPAVAVLLMDKEEEEASTSLEAVMPTTVVVVVVAAGREVTGADDRIGGRRATASPVVMAVVAAGEEGGETFNAAAATPVPAPAGEGVMPNAGGNAGPVAETVHVEEIATPAEDDAAATGPAAAVPKAVIPKAPAALPKSPPPPELLEAVAAMPKLPAAGAPTVAVKAPPVAWSSWQSCMLDMPFVVVVAVVARVKKQHPGSTAFSFGSSACDYKLGLSSARASNTRAGIGLAAMD